MSVYLLIMEKPYLHKALSLRSPIVVSSLPTKWSSLILIIDVNAAMAIIKTKRSMHVVRCHRDYQGWARQKKNAFGFDGFLKIDLTEFKTLVISEEDCTAKLHERLNHNLLFIYGRKYGEKF